MIVRKTYPELTENHINPMCEILRCHHPDKSERIASYNDSKKNIQFPNGSRILFRYCDTEKDASRFQGTEVDVLFIDEATHQSEMKFKKLTACVRGVNDFPKRVYLSMNPGSEGHHWVKRLFIDRAYDIGENPDDYVFIQSLVTDNDALMRSNPDYIRQLEALPPKLKQAWLEGRWDVFDGAFFEEFRVTPEPQKCYEAGISVEEALEDHKYTHVIEPFEIPKEWKIYRSYDFGYGKPFSLCWWAVDHEGCAYQILELYGCTGTPNEGVKWTAKEQFTKIREIEEQHPWLKGKRIMGVADPSIWDGSRGISVAEDAEKCGIYFERGNNERIAGWMQVRERLKFDNEGNAMMYFFNNCVNSIRTIPLMMFDEHKVEDLDTDLEDHIVDSIRYFCMMRPIAPRTIETKMKPMHDPLNQYAEHGKYHKYNAIRRG